LLLFYADIATIPKRVLRNESLSLNFPNNTLLCNFSEDLLLLAISFSCYFPVNFDRLDNFKCYNNSRKFTINYDNITHETIFSDWDDNLTETVVLFMCNDGPKHKYTYSYNIKIGKNTL